MFENIRFRTYQMTTMVTSDAIKKKLSAQDCPDNIKNANFSIDGNVHIFPKPPASDFVMQNLYHMDGFSMFSCGKNFFTQRRDYHSFLILYTYKGNGQLEYDNRTYHLSEGDGFFIDCRLPQLYKTTGEFWKHSVFHLNGPLVPALFKQYSAGGSVCFSQPISGSYQISLEKLLSIYNNTHPYRDWLAADCISTILTGLLADSSTNKIQSMPVNLQIIVKYMEDHLSSAITLDYLSHFFGISKYYLSREFKKYTGFSPNDYLIRLRMEHAKTLLLSTNLPANKIAHMVGIHDVNNFNNLFKKRNGVTPGQFRKQ